MEDIGLNYESFLTPLLELAFLIFMILMHFRVLRSVRRKKTAMGLSTIIFLFVMIVGVISIQNFMLPFSPFIQLFFILFNFFIFISIMMEFRK